MQHSEVLALLALDKRILVTKRASYDSNNSLLVDSVNSMYTTIKTVDKTRKKIRLFRLASAYDV